MSLRVGQLLCAPLRVGQLWCSSESGSVGGLDKARAAVVFSAVRLLWGLFVGSIAHKTHSYLITSGSTLERSFKLKHTQEEVKQETGQ